MSTNVPSFIDRMNEIARMQGKDQIDPTRIEGFSPPHPDFTSEPEPIDSPSLPPQMPEWPVPERPAPEPQPEPVRQPEAKLIVVDGKAEFSGYSVRLSERDQAIITGVVVKALQRAFKELMPKRKRKARVRPTGTAPEQSAPPVLPPKRRGRPPRQRLDGSVS